MKSHKKYFDDIAYKWNEMPKDEDRLISLVDRFDIDLEDSILDLGTGTGLLLPYYSKKVKNNSQIKALDISVNMLKKAVSKNDAPDSGFICGDVCRLPFINGCFSKVICFAVFPHLLNKQKGLSEIERITKPGGTIIIAHLMGSKKLNEFHSNLNEPVRSDVLPELGEFDTLIKGLPLRKKEAFDYDDLFFLKFSKIEF